MAESSGRRRRITSGSELTRPRCAAPPPPLPQPPTPLKPPFLLFINFSLSSPLTCSLPPRFPSFLPSSSPSVFPSPLISFFFLFLFSLLPFPQFLLLLIYHSFNPVIPPFLFPLFSSSLHCWVLPFFLSVANFFLILHSYFSLSFFPVSPFSPIFLQTLFSRYSFLSTYLFSLLFFFLPLYIFLPTLIRPFLLSILFFFTLPFLTNNLTRQS